jgi:beta-glucosidase
VHSQETDRHLRSFQVSARALHEYYLPAFKACFVEAKAVSVMTAHSGFNNTPCAANRWLLTDLLRDRWGFDGAVVTDWGGTRRISDAHRLVNSDEDAVVAVVTAGVDVLCEPKPIRNQIVNAVNLGLLEEPLLDKALARALKVRFRLGEFDPPEMVPYAQIPPAVIGAKEHVDLALRTARESIVLLKNAPVPHVTAGRPILPLKRGSIESIAVIGPYADQPQFGAYSGTPANPPVSVLAGVRKLVGPGVVVKTARWGDTAAATKAAMECDAVVVVMGLNHQLEKEGADRPDTTLPEMQTEFIEKIVQVNPATVVVLEGGGQMSVEWINQHAAALLHAWYPGEQGGTAIAEVLFGDYNPAGRLPLTFYAADQELPPLDDYEITRGRTYMYLRSPPLFPFGHGLSYTAFDYANLRVEPASAAASGLVTVRARVTNSGGRDGDEVVQLYVRPAAPKVIQPLKRLCGFRRVHLAAGESRDVELTFAVQDLAYWDEATSRFVVEAGAYEAMVGASSGDLRLKAPFEIR